MKEIHGNWEGPPLALFWDQSLVWGLICLETLRKLAIPFQLLTGREIAQGHLAGYRVLLVPGGWASHKIKALGTTGREEISRFIEEGGSYLGFCGGAGLALSSHPSLCLVPLERMPLSERLPSASGQIWVQGNPQHPTWENLPPCLPVSIWWPSQFSGNHSRESSILATYVHAGENFMVADLPVVDLPLVSEEEGAIPWKEMEKLYGINLNPDRILGHPAIIEVKKRKGETGSLLPSPGNSWRYLGELPVFKYSQIPEQIGFLLLFPFYPGRACNDENVTLPRPHFSTLLPPIPGSGRRTDPIWRKPSSLAVEKALVASLAARHPRIGIR